MPRFVLGIDPAKRVHHAALVDLVDAKVLKEFRFTNDRASLLRIQELLDPLRPDIEVRLETTGAYHYPLASVLQDRYAVRYYHPLQLRKEKGVGIRKTKTDKIDARAVAFTTKPAPLTDYHDGARLELREACRWRKTLVDSTGDWLRRLNRAVHLLFPLLSNEKDVDLVSKSLQDLLVVFPTPEALVEAGADAVFEAWQTAARGNARRERAERLVDVARESLSTTIARQGLVRQVRDCVALIRAHQERLRDVEKTVEALWAPLAARHALHLLPGIGLITAATLVGELGEIGHYKSADAVVASCGLDPSTSQTGGAPARAGRISKRGSPLARWTLAMAVQSMWSRRSNAVITDYLARKREEGKPYRLAQTATAKKLSRIIYAVERKHAQGIPIRDSSSQAPGS